MRNRKIRVLHEGNEYYLVDRGRTTSSRVITILKRLEKGHEEELAAMDGAVTVKTDLGDCLAIANWNHGELITEPGHDRLRPALSRIVDRYLEEFRVGRRRATTRTYYFLSIDRQPLFCLSNAQPTGLSVLVFNDEKRAAAAAQTRRGIESRDIQVEAVGDLFDFLTARATEGFAGATLDEVDPIFFCLDAGASPSFLRLSLDRETGQLEHFLLNPDGGWTAYEGEEEITPEIDQEVVDQYTADRLGALPFLGYYEGMPLYRIAREEDREQLVMVEVEPDAGDDPICPLFHDEALAHEFLKEHQLTGCELRRVDDVVGFCARVQELGRLVQIHPGAHRARGGTLWVNGAQLVLDSFSGLWSSTDGVAFEHNVTGDLES